MKLFNQILFPVLLITFLLLQPLLANTEFLSVKISHDDGGKTSERHIVHMIDALNENGCRTVIFRPSSKGIVQLVFDPGPVSLVAKQKTEYRLIARAKTLDGAVNVRGAIVVHAARGVSDLSSLKGEWISFVSKNSWSGYRLPIELLQDAGVNEKDGHFYFVGNHVGAVSALLHKDVHVAVLAEPLARRWADANSLVIVAVSEAVETGGWWIHHSVPEKQQQLCQQALTSLTRSHHKALPAWIDGFVLPE